MADKNKPTERQLATLQGLGVTAPTTRKACSLILDWIRKGGPESGRRIRILQDGQVWVGQRVKEKDGPMTGTVLFILPKTPESILNSGRESAVAYPYRNPLDAKVRRDEDGKAVLISVGRIEPMLISSL